MVDLGTGYGPSQDLSKFWYTMASQEASDKLDKFDRVANDDYTLWITRAEMLFNLS